MTSESKAIALMQNWSEVYDLADNYKNQQQWQSAAAAFRRATELDPNSFWSYHHLGDVLSKQEQWQQAVQAYDRAIQLDPDFFWSWHNLGSALGKLQQWERAVEAYRQAVQLDPNFFWSWYGLGNALGKLQQWDRAIASYIRAIQLQPQHQLVYQKLATAFKQQGNLSESIQHYRQLIKSPDSDSIFNSLKAQPEKLLEIARILDKQHQTFAAIILYYMILEIQPDEVEILQHLTKLIAQSNQLEQKIAQRQQKLTENNSSQLLTRLETKPSGKSVKKYPAGKVIIQDNCLVLPNQIEQLCHEVGWQNRPLDKVERAIEQSFGYVCAWYVSNEKQKLVGFARAIADGAFNAMLLDVAVHPDFQGFGIGKKVVKNMVQQLQASNIQDITLLASPHMVDFYHKLGFVSQPNNLQWMLWCS